MSQKKSKIECILEFISEKNDILSNELSTVIAEQGVEDSYELAMRSEILTAQIELLDEMYREVSLLKDFGD